MDVRARGHVDAELTMRRERIARAMLVGLALLGVVAYVPSMWLSLRVGAYVIAVVDTIAYASLLLVLIFAKGRTRLQSGFLVLLCYLLGLVLSLALGPMGAGPLWLGIAPAIAAVLFDRTATYAALVTVFVTALLVALAAHTGLIEWGAPADNVPLWWVLSANAILVGAGVALAVAALVGGLRESAENAAHATEQLRQAEKLTAIGTLATGIAHDFNNLLTPVLAAPEILRDETVPKEQRDRVLERVEEAAVAGRQLVQRIMAFSRPTGAGREPLDAAAAFGEAFRLLRASLPASVELDTDLGESGHVRLSLAEVHQLVLNLGSNAGKAMPEGGRLTFRVEQVDAVDVVGWAPDPYTDRAIRIEATDTGIGMAPATASQVFDPFFTTDLETGTGMGLATVHGIVASAGGVIRCDSGPGVGTTFTLHLPVVAPGATDAPASRAVPMADPGGHLLLVEDEEAVRDVTARGLRRAGYEVTPVADAAAALTVLDATPRIRAVITDRNMPGTSGLQLAQEIRRCDSDIGVILITGLVDEEIETRAREIGVDRIVAKPFRPTELVAALQEVLAERER